MPVRTYLEELCRWPHRGSTTENERQAAEYIREQMAALGLESRVEHFVSHTSFSWVYLVIYGGFFIAGWLLWERPLFGLLVCALMLAFFHGECSSRWKALANLLPKKPSQNVLGIFRNEAARKKVVLVAHYDSSKSGLSFHPSMVGSFRSSFLISYAMMLILTAALVIRWFGGTGTLLSVARIVPTLYMLLPIILLVHRELFGQYVQGAADNASGVAAMLGVAEKLVKQPPKNLEAWCVATGCEEVNLTGMAAFMRAHHYELSQSSTYFINFDNLGKGSLRYITGEGMLKVYQSAPKLVCIAEELAERAYPDVRPYVYRRATLDALVASSRDYKTISLMGLDAGDAMPHWHWPTDTIENVDFALAERASEFAFEMVSELDRRSAPSGER
ncbi:MAG: M28 family peptidase [Candidatus Abyssubacteria bacterium]